MADTPTEEFMNKLGKPPADDRPKMSVDELYGTRQNPVREDALPAANLRDAGK